MRKTYAYNGITLGAIAGFAVGITTNNWGIGIAVAVVGSVVCFAGIRALENLIDKGVNKAGSAIRNKFDESHKNDNAGQSVTEGKKLCPYCGAEIDVDATDCPSCGKSLE